MQENQLIKTRCTRTKVRWKWKDVNYCYVVRHLIKSVFSLKRSHALDCNHHKLLTQLFFFASYILAPKKRIAMHIPLNMTSKPLNLFNDVHTCWLCCHHSLSFSYTQLVANMAFNYEFFG